MDCKEASYIEGAINNRLEIALDEAGCFGKENAKEELKAKARKLAEKDVTNMRRKLKQIWLCLKSLGQIQELTSRRS